MSTISLEVSNELAERFKELSDKRRDELIRIIGAWVKKPRPLIEVMTEIGEYASQQGITEKQLKKLLIS